MFGIKVQLLGFLSTGLKGSRSGLEAPELASAPLKNDKILVKNQEFCSETSTDI